MKNGTNTASINEDVRTRVTNIQTQGYRNGTNLAVNVIDMFGRVLTIPPMPNPALRDDVFTLRSTILHNFRTQFTKLGGRDNVVSGPFRGKPATDLDTVVEFKYDIDELWGGDIYCEELNVVLTTRGLEDLPVHPAMDEYKLSSIGADSKVPCIQYKIFIVCGGTEPSGMYINMFGMVHEVPTMACGLPKGLYVLHNGGAGWHYARHDIRSDGPFPLHMSKSTAESTASNSEYAEVVAHLRHVADELEKQKQFYKDESERLVRQSSGMSTQFSTVSKGLSSIAESNVRKEEMEIKHNLDLQSSARKNSGEFLKQAPGIVGSISVIAGKILQG